MRHIAPLSIGFASAALLSCGGGDLVLPTEGEPATIAIVQGNGLTGRVGEPLAEPLVIRVLDGTGQRVQGATVVIELSAGSAEPDTADTDSLGEVTSAITLGSQVGETQGAARVIKPEGEVAPAGFTLVALAASANGLAMVSGDSQQGTAGTTLAEPLVVEVTDAFGNAIPDVPITWTAQGGGSVSESSTATDADGRTSVLRTLGSASGTQTTEARSEGLAGSPVVFNHTVTAGNPSGVRIVSGNEQVGLPGTTLPQPLVVDVVDGSGNPVIGAAVTWVVTAGGGSLDPTTGTTDENGRSSTTWTLGPGTGTNTAQAVVSGVGQAVFTATASAGDPDDIVIVSGNEQQGQAGTRLANSLVVQVVDDADNPVTGVTVTWQVESGGGSVTPRNSATDGSGRASTAWTLGRGTGEQRVNASAPGAGSVRFEATSTAGSPSVLGIVTQPPGNAEVGVRFTRQPVIQVRDAAGNAVPASGVTITVAVANGAGSLIGTTTRSTDANGRATFTDLGITGATGNHRLLFAASGFSSVTSGLIRVSTTETRTQITSDSPDPSEPGEGVEVVFQTVTSGAAPSGTVRVTASGGGESCSAEVSVGRCTIVLNGDGDRTLTATFQGNSLFQSSSDTESHQVITPDRPPTAQDDNYSATRGVPLTVGAGDGVLANDSDPDGDPMTAAVVDGPDRGTLTFNPDGSFVYTSSADFFGSDSFTYQVTAGGVTDTATVTIIVS
jgi:adhesin/invasin